jgi:hypothetical protein
MSFKYPILSNVKIDAIAERPLTPVVDIIEILMDVDE